MVVIYFYESLTTHITAMSLLLLQSVWTSRKKVPHILSSNRDSDNSAELMMYAKKL